MNKIIDIQKYQKKQLNSRKMLFVSMLVGLVIGLILWKYFVENIANYDVKIPASSNISFNNMEPKALLASDLAIEFEESDNQPILLYIFTTWCQACSKNYPIINEIAREFQNTELKVLAIAIDRDLEPQKLKHYLNNYGENYFTPNFLSSKNGFVELLNKKNIKYSGRIPFVVLLSREGEVVMKYSGVKSKNYLRNKVIKELYPN
ncbi:MAG: TlpA family protein disulfide reductase [Proteobacteria bacterium]|nr:TlpA family protein disulfide reductase [Pseudomonadota bacterium]NCA28846.1 TlpA family protein disulfide reductase [Pseudomonadota bacterium]